MGLILTSLLSTIFFHFKIIQSRKDGGLEETIEKGVELRKPGEKLDEQTGYTYANTTKIIFMGLFVFYMVQLVLYSYFYRVAHHYHLIFEEERRLSEVNDDDFHDFSERKVDF